MRHYIVTLIPGFKKDDATMRKIASGAKIHPNGESAIFGYLPLSDRDDNGKRTRFPQGEDVYTDYGWNNLAEVIRHFNEGDTVTLQGWK